MRFGLLQGAVLLVRCLCFVKSIELGLCKVRGSASLSVALLDLLLVRCLSFVTSDLAFLKHADQTFRRLTPNYYTVSSSFLFMSASHTVGVEEDLDNEP